MLLIGEFQGPKTLQTGDGNYIEYLCMNEGPNKTDQNIYYKVFRVKIYQELRLITLVGKYSITLCSHKDKSFLLRLFVQSGVLKLHSYNGIALLPMLLRMDFADYTWVHYQQLRVLNLINQKIRRFCTKHEEIPNFIALSCRHLAIASLESFV